MALAPLNPNHTARLFLDYATPRLRHTLMLRIPTGKDVTTVMTSDEFDMLVTNLSAFTQEYVATTGARYAAAGSNIAFPITCVRWAAFDPLDESNSTSFQEPIQYSWTYRSQSSGRKGRFTWFPYRISTDESFRYNDGEWVLADAVRASFQVLSDVGYVCAIDGAEYIVHEYTNLTMNAHAVKTIRS